MMRSVRQHIARLFGALFLRWAFLAPVAVAAAVGLALVSQAQTLWFQTLSIDATVQTGASIPPLSGALPAARARRATSTPEACATTSLGSWQLADDSSSVGAGPFRFTVSITNNGASPTAGGVLLGVITHENPQYIDHVTFRDGQTWRIEGNPAYTLVLVDDIGAGESHPVQLRVDMTKAWIDAPDRAQTSIGFGIAASPPEHDCVTGGDALAITLRRSTETPTPTAVVNATSTPSETTARLTPPSAASPTATHTDATPISAATVSNTRTAVPTHADSSATTTPTPTGTHTPTPA